MKTKISNYTSIGNTDDKSLKVTEIVAAVAVSERENLMTNEVKFSEKATLSLSDSKENENGISLQI